MAALTLFWVLLCDRLSAVLHVFQTFFAGYYTPKRELPETLQKSTRGHSELRASATVAQGRHDFSTRGSSRAISYEQSWVKLYYACTTLVLHFRTLNEKSRKTKPLPLSLRGRLPHFGQNSELSCCMPHQHTSPSFTALQDV